MIAVAFAATAAVGGAADSVMRRQADGFLQALPDGLQQKQTLAVEKAIAGDNAALLGIDASRISAGGDSSGGNLALAVALSDECRGALESLVLFYPVTKAFADGSESWRRYGSGYGLDADLMEAFNRAYLGGTDSENHAVSVGLCSGEQLRRLPRTLLVAAGRDILRDQGCELAEKSGGRIERVEFPDAVHLFITVPGQDEAFRKAVDLTYEFITQKQ